MDLLRGGPPCQGFARSSEQFGLGRCRGVAARSAAARAHRAGGEVVSEAELIIALVITQNMLPLSRTV
jgi:hypothetical protein